MATLLADMTDVLRMLGIIGARLTEQSVTSERARAMDEFLRTVVGYVCVAPNQIQKLRDDLARLRAASAND